MRFRKILCGVSAAAVMLGSVTVAASAEELRSAVVEKTYGADFMEDYITYSENPDGTLNVKNSYKNVTKVVIPETVNGKRVTAIGDSAFTWCDSLTSITLPNSIKSIGESAFYHCERLSSITIPNGVTSIGDTAFNYCKNLTSITIPNSVTYVGHGAFSGCEKLTSVTLPDSVTFIGNSAFASCFNLKSITIPTGVTTIDYYTFSFCRELKDIYYRGTKQQWENLIANSAWDGDVEVGEDDYGIRPEFYTPTVHFADSSASSKPDDSKITQNGITYEELSDGTLSVKSADENITKADIPKTVNGKTVTVIGEKAFQSCKSLTSVTIPNSITSIGDSAFSDCYNLSSVTIPNSVTYIGDSAFYACTGLTSVSLPNNITSIGARAFSECIRLSSITIPGSVTSISDETFSECRSLASVIIPDTVKSIGQGAFAICEGLTSFTIPSSVISIGNAAFAFSHNLKDINYTGTEQQWEKMLNDSDWDGRIRYFNVNDEIDHFTPTVHFTESSGQPDYDINGDNSVTISDVVYLLRKVVIGETDLAYDVNGDGFVNISDVIRLLKVVVSGT